MSLISVLEQFEHSGTYGNVLGSILGVNEVYVGKIGIPQLWAH